MSHRTAGARELRRSNGRLRIEQVVEAGLGLHFDRPERFIAVVGAFLGSISG